MISIRALVLLVTLCVAAFCVTGCAAIAGIFKAGVWVGLVGALLLLGCAALLVGLLSR